MGGAPKLGTHCIALLATAPSGQEQRPFLHVDPPVHVVVGSQGEPGDPANKGQ